MRASTIALLFLLAARPSPAAAQAAGAPDRVTVQIDAGGQLSSIAFDTATTRAVYLETAAIGTSYRIRRGLLGDAGVALRVGGNFGIGITVSSIMARDDGEIRASIPHPFFFRTPRTVTGTASGLRRDELVAHLQAIYTIHPSRKVDLALSGGPSMFRVQQDVVTDIAFTDLYPYDTAAYASASTQRVRANKMGFNAGADMTLRLSRHAGVGGGARFARATVSLPVPNGTSTVPADAGGIQAVGGLRLFF
jgi:hypothetical protein